MRFCGICNKHFDRYLTHILMTEHVEKSKKESEAARGYTLAKKEKEEKTE